MSKFEGVEAIVDASNYMRPVGAQSGKRSLNNLEAVLRALVAEFPGITLRLLFDHGDWYRTMSEAHISETGMIKRLKKVPGVSSVNRAPSGHSADLHILKLASDKRAFVVSNDNFNKNKMERKLRAGIPLLALAALGSEISVVSLFSIYGGKGGQPEQVSVEGLFQHFRASRCAAIAPAVLQDFCTEVWEVLSAEVVPGEFLSLAALAALCIQKNNGFESRLRAVRATGSPEDALREVLLQMVGIVSVGPHQGEDAVQLRQRAPSRTTSATPAQAAAPTPSPALPLTEAHLEEAVVQKLSGGPMPLDALIGAVKNDHGESLSALLKTLPRSKTRGVWRQFLDRSERLKRQQRAGAWWVVRTGRIGDPSGVKVGPYTIALVRQRLADIAGTRDRIAGGVVVGELKPMAPKAWDMFLASTVDVGKKKRWRTFCERYLTDWRREGGELVRKDPSSRPQRTMLPSLQAWVQALKANTSEPILSLGDANQVLREAGYDWRHEEWCEGSWLVPLAQAVTVVRTDDGRGAFIQLDATPGAASNLDMQSSGERVG